MTKTTIVSWFLERTRHIAALYAELPIRKASAPGNYEGSIAIAAVNETVGVLYQQTGSGFVQHRIDALDLLPELGRRCRIDYAAPRRGGSRSSARRLRRRQ
ncbi:KfrB domain-containing protein [Pyramidobacter piscolens]|uniref:KfrB domain-containing protein n=1 Tax=Pyramidobacter piscolens TaxID=638849 RepID=UPI003AB4A9A7